MRIPNLSSLRSAVALVALAMGGCAVNPYHEDTMCPSRNDFGQCVSTPEAYKQTLDGTEPENKGAPSSEDGAATEEGKSAEKAKAVAGDSSAATTYRKELYTELATLLKAPKTPMIKPPTIRRILVLPYEDDALYMPRYIYMVVNEGTWVLDEQATEGQADQSVELFSDHEK